MSVHSSIKELYKLVGGSSDDHFVFTSSGAESVNHAVMAAYLDITRKTGKNHFITSNIEEASQILSISRLQELGCSLTFVQANSSGKVTLQSIVEAITPRTAFLSLTAANGLTGVMNTDLPAIAKLCRERGILFHLDASHTLGKSHFIWESDLLSFHGEDIMAPAGTGALFFRGSLDLSPLIMGGEEQSSLRGGTFSKSLLIEFGKAAANCAGHSMMEILLLRNHFEESLQNALPEIKIHFQNEERTPHISCIDFINLHGEALQLLLQRKGIASHTGGGRFQRLPLLLQACHISSHTSLSFTFSPHTTRTQIDETLTIILECVHHLQKFSKYLNTSEVKV